MAIKQQANAPLIITVGIVSAMMVLVIMIGIQAWFVKEEQDEIETKWQMNKSEQLLNLQAAQRARLNNYAWSSRDRQTVVIPIEEAMKLIVQNGGRLPATQPKN